MMFDHLVGGEDESGEDGSEAAAASSQDLHNIDHLNMENDVKLFHIDLAKYGLGEEMKSVEANETPLLHYLKTYYTSLGYYSQESATDPDLSWDEADIPNEKIQVWSFNDFMEQYNQLYSWLNNIQVQYHAAKKKEGASSPRVETLLRDLERDVQRRERFLRECGRMVGTRPELESEVGWRLEHVMAKWDLLINMRIKNRSPDTPDHSDIEEEVKSLRKWLKEMEARIDPLEFSRAAQWSTRDREIKMAEYQVLQTDIEAHGRIVKLVLSLCEDPSLDPSLYDLQHALKTAKSLERRWHHIWLRSLEWQCLLEQCVQESIQVSRESTAATGGDLVRSDEEEPLNKMPRLNAAVLCPSTGSSPAATLLRVKKRKRWIKNNGNHGSDVDGGSGTELCTDEISSAGDQAGGTAIDRERQQLELELAVNHGNEVTTPTTSRPIKSAKQHRRRRLQQRSRPQPRLGQDSNLTGDDESGEYSSSSATSSGEEDMLTPKNEKPFCDQSGELVDGKSSTATTDCINSLRDNWLLEADSVDGHKASGVAACINSLRDSWLQRINTNVGPTQPLTYWDTSDEEVLLHQQHREEDEYLEDDLLVPEVCPEDEISYSSFFLPSLAVDNKPVEVGQGLEDSSMAASSDPDLSLRLDNLGLEQQQQHNLGRQAQGQPDVESLSFRSSTTSSSLAMAGGEVGEETSRSGQSASSNDQLMETLSQRSSNSLHIGSRGSAVEDLSEELSMAEPKESVLHTHCSDKIEDLVADQSLEDDLSRSSGSPSQSFSDGKSTRGDDRQPAKKSSKRSSPGPPEDLGPWGLRLPRRKHRKRSVNPMIDLEDSQSDVELEERINVITEAKQRLDLLLAETSDPSSSLNYDELDKKCVESIAELEALLRMLQPPTTVMAGEECFINNKKARETRILMSKYERLRADLARSRESRFKRDSLQRDLQRLKDSLLSHVAAPQTPPSTENGSARADSATAGHNEGDAEEGKWPQSDLSSTDDLSEDDLNVKLHKLQDDLTRLSDYKSELFQLNLGVHNYLAETQAGSNQQQAALLPPPASGTYLQETVSGLYTLWEECHHATSARIAATRDTLDRYRLFHKELASLKKLLRRDAARFSKQETKNGRTGAAPASGAKRKDVRDVVVEDPTGGDLSDVGEMTLNKSIKSQLSLHPHLTSDSGISDGSSCHGSGCSSCHGSTCSSSISSGSSSCYSDCDDHLPQRREEQLERLRRLANCLGAGLDPSGVAAARLQRCLASTQSQLRKVQRAYRLNCSPKAVVNTGNNTGRKTVPEQSTSTSSTRSATSKRRRVARLAIGFQLLLLVLWLAGWAIQPRCCDYLGAVNFSPQLKYVNGPPPI